MKINADLSQPARINSLDLDWIASPMPGVHRRMLERDGDEVARATTIVRFDPNSHFSEHIHEGGEEFLVLDGVFSDEYGDFPAGTYVRNPVGSKHIPHTEEGCTILVKLHWMHAGDQEFVRTETGDDGAYRTTETNGVRELPLHSYQSASERMLLLDAGSSLPARDVPGGEEIFVVEGSCSDHAAAHETGTWIRTPVGTAPELTSNDGCRLLVTRGHLTDPPPLPT